MGLTNAGRNQFAAAIIGDSTTDFNNANAYIGAGNSSGAFAASQIDLQGGSTARKGMDTSYPTRTANVLVFRSTFSTSEANFQWLEWGVFNGTSATGTMLNRAIESLGTKTSAQSWQITSTLTLNAA